jgi:hypothetical protein
MPRFSLRSLFVGVAVLGAVIALKALALPSAIMVATYFGSRTLSIRAWLVVVILSSAFCVLPWLGLGGGSLIGPGRVPSLLPTIELSPESRSIVRPLYSLAELPLVFLGSVSDDLNSIIYFGGEGKSVVMPFVVFEFWLCIVLTVGASGIVSIIERRCREREPRSGAIE